MQCPKCGSALSPFSAGFSATIHRCENCHGIACSDDALSDLQRQWFLWPKHDPREIDPGARREGRRWNEKSDVPCRMTFFDAGEMTDLRFDTLADSLRGLMARLRGG
jgi:hypothetical protein